MRAFASRRVGRFRETHVAAAKGPTPVASRLVPPHEGEGGLDVYPRPSPSSTSTSNVSRNLDTIM